MKENEIAKSIREIAKAFSNKDSLFAAKVKSVEARTCTVLPVSGGAELPNVRLNSDIENEVGLIITPKLQSVVLVLSISNTDALVIMFSEIEKMSLIVGNSQIDINNDEIIFNKGANNSYLTDINKLVSKLNQIETQINNLKTIFTAWVPVPMDGGAILKAATAAWAAQPIVATQIMELKDNSIKH